MNEKLREEIKEELKAEYRDGHNDALNPDRAGASVRLEERTNQILSKLQPYIEQAKKEERGRIIKLYEDMACVPEEDNVYYSFWQALLDKEVD